MSQNNALNIYQSINAIMDEIPAIGKNQTNAQQGFKYRGIDAVMNALQPALSKHGVFVVPEILSHTREDRVTQKGANLIYSVIHVKYTFYAQDGSFVIASVIGEGMDSADKSTNKALSVAFKYACFQVFCIPTEEMIDPDSETPEPSEPKKEPEKVAPKPIYSCEECGELFKPGEYNGIPFTAEEAYNQAFKSRGAHVCGKCYKKPEKVKLGDV